MKEYILTFTFPNGEVKSIRKLLSSKDENYVLKSIGIYDKKNVVLSSAEPVEINVRSELKKLFLSK